MTPNTKDSEEMKEVSKEEDPTQNSNNSVSINKSEKGHETGKGDGKDEKKPLENIKKSNSQDNDGESIQVDEPISQEIEKVEEIKKVRKIDNGDYDANSITVLEGLEGVRKRPAMYIGSTGKKGFHHLAIECIDNSIDEALAGYCDLIRVTIHEDESISIFDNGRGIPVAPHPKKKVSTLEVIFSSLHSGGKFDSKSYKISGGLHGVGLAVVNACSEWTEITVWRNGKKFFLRCGEGKIYDHVKEVPLGENESPNKTGTEIRFRPDPKIFTSIPKEEFEFDFDYLESHLRDLAYLNPIEIELFDNREFHKEEISFNFEGGLLDFVKFINATKKPIHEAIRFTDEQEDIYVDVAFQYTNTYQTLIRSYVNNIHTQEGGTHLTGFKSAFTRCFNQYLKDHSKIKKKLQGNKKSLKGSDVREGLTAIVSVRVPEPQFEGQTKTKLGNPEVQSIVSGIVYGKTLEYFDSHPDETAEIMMKCVSAQRARIASQKAKNLARRKSALDGLRLPGKLADCSSNDPEECEIFIVEGNSAGGSAKQGRDRRTQAILPLRGKILNVEKARLGKVLNNREVVSMIKAIGVGIKESNDDSDRESDIEFDLSKLRYHKIVIMCDADVDGHHIETLLLTFFFRFMRPLVDAGHVYLAVPPIYKLKYRSKQKYLYIQDRADLLEQEVKKFMEEEDIKKRSWVKTQRYKGLGEMNPEELWYTTMNPESRHLHRVKYEDLVKTDNIFSMLMGKEVKPRRDFIMENYNEALNLDV